MSNTVDKSQIIKTLDALERMAAEGETATSMAEKAAEFSYNVQALFKSIKNLHEELGADIAMLAEISVVCQIAAKDTVLSRLVLGEAANVASSISTLHESFDNKIKASPQERSEP